MAGFRRGSPEQERFLGELLDADYLIESGVSGVYGRGEAFERVQRGFAATVDAVAADEGPEHMSFPPLLPRRQLEELGYLKSFPHLACTVFSFDGDDEQAAEQERLAAAHEDWSGFQEMTDLALKPAACYPVYPAIAARGPLPPGGVTIDVGASYVFRHEPSGDPARLQAFHQREMVRIGEPGAVLEWRDLWRDRSVELLRAVGLDADLDLATDPFFGRTGRFLARSQRAQELKFEVVVQIAGPEPTAVASFNYHQDHFSGVYGIEMRGGDGGDRTAHTACLGFGLERITMALVRHHGLDQGAWPPAVRETLRL